MVSLRVLAKVSRGFGPSQAVWFFGNRPGVQRPDDEEVILGAFPLVLKLEIFKSKGNKG